MSRLTDHENKVQVRRSSCSKTSHGFQCEFETLITANGSNIALVLFTILGQLFKLTVITTTYHIMNETAKSEAKPTKTIRSNAPHSHIKRKYQLFHDGMEWYLTN